MNDFPQIVWDSELEAECRQLVRLAVAEDWGDCGDITSQAIIPPSASGKALVVARQDGVVCGIRAVASAIDGMEVSIRWQPLIADGTSVSKGAVIGFLEGAVREMLAAERILLNFLGKLSGIATLTRQYVKAVSHTQARIYDTRKTTPGWRRLEKFAVRCGGGYNHRLGLHAAILIKDNHLAFLSSSVTGKCGSAARWAVEEAKRFREKLGQPSCPVEIEVDTLQQLGSVLEAAPDIVLLDNMDLADLRAAVMLRNEIAPRVQLEASGGVRLETVTQIAETGVDRISVGALTHHACWLDVALDWESA